MDTACRGLYDAFWEEVGRQEQMLQVWRFYSLKEECLVKGLVTIRALEYGTVHYRI